MNFVRQKNIERESRGRVGTEAILDPQPKVCWFWRRKRERELTFIETKIKSGNRVLEKRRWK